MAFEFSQVVMAIKMRQELLSGLYTGINTKHIVMSSKMVLFFYDLYCMLISLN